LKILFNLEGYHLALFCAIVQRYAAVGVPCKKQACMPRHSLVNPGEPFEMAQMILGYGMWPANDALKNGRRRHSHGSLQVLVDGAHQASLVPVHDLGPMPAATNRTQQNGTVWRTARID